jgi:hypothetical protein
MPQAVSRRLLVAETPVRSCVGPCGFVVDRVTLGQDCLAVRQLSSSSFCYQKSKRASLGTFLSAILLWKSRKIGQKNTFTWSLCVLCGSENKQRLFPYTALTDWFV